MAIGTVAGAVYTPPAATSVTDNMLSGLKAPFLSDNEVLDSDGAFWCTLEWAAIGSIVGGLVARNRAAKGEEPMLKFLY